MSGLAMRHHATEIVLLCCRQLTMRVQRRKATTKSDARTCEMRRLARGTEVNAAVKEWRMNDYVRLSLSFAAHLYTH